MQLNISTDYAIRVLLYLAKTSKIVSSSKLSSAIGVSSRYLLQIGAKLRDANLITTTYGSAGGYALTKPPRDISLFDIIVVMEGKIRTGKRSDSENGLEETECRLLNVAYEYLDNVLVDILKSITIDNLLTQSLEEWYLAPCLLNLGDSK